MYIKSRKVYIHHVNSMYMYMMRVQLIKCWYMYMVDDTLLVYNHFFSSRQLSSFNNIQMNYINIKSYN